jgi:DEP domain-containing protein 5
MFKIQHFLEGKAVYKNRLLEFMGIRFTVRGLYNKENQEIFTGVVKVAQTKVSFYSKSSQVYILIELSEEMYHFDENGYLLHEKCMQFLRAYFERCVKSSSSHEVTLVIYSRLYYPQVKNKEELKEALRKFYGQAEPMSDGEIDELGAF